MEICYLFNDTDNHFEVMYDKSSKYYCADILWFILDYNKNDYK